MKNKGWRKTAQKKVFWLIMPISGVALILLGLVWILSSKKYIESSVLTSHKLALGAMEQTTDVILNNFDETIETIIQDVDVINLAATPNFTDYSRNRRVILLLNSMENVSYKKSISLYLPWLDTVFSSNMTTLPFSESPIRDAVPQYDNEYWQLGDFGDGKYDTSRIMLAEDGSIYVMRSFPRHDSMMYVVAIEMDADRLFADFAGDAAEDNEGVMILSPEGIVLMCSDSSEIGKYYSLPEHEAGSTFQYSQGEKGDMFVSRSNYSGLCFVIYSQDSFAAWTQRTLSISILTLFVVAIIQFICAGLAAMLIFRPIEKLVNLALTSRTTAENELIQQQTEFGYLNKAYEQIMEHQLTTGKTISVLRHIIINKLVISAYTDASVSASEMKDMDDFLVMANKSSKRYQVILLRIVDDEKMPFGCQDQDIVFLELTARGILDNELQDMKSSIQYIGVDKRSMVILIAYDEGTECHAEVRHSVQCMQSSLEEAFGQHLIFIASEDSVETKTLSNEIRWLKVAAAAQEHALSDKRTDSLAGAMNSRVIIAKYEYLEDDFSQALDEAFKKLSCGKINKLLMRFRNKADKNATTESFCAMYIFTNVLGDFANKESMPVRVAEFLLNEKQVLSKLLDGGSGIDSVIFRANLSVSAAIRLYNENLIIGQYSMMKDVMAFIEQHYAEQNFGLGSVADEMGISNSRLSKEFKEYTGQNFVSYMNEYKIERAQFMLLDTDVAIREISETVGFTTVQHFIRTFKLLTGCTPGAYRSNYLKYVQRMIICQ